MGHTYVHFRYHVVFSTKDRRPLITDNVKPDLYSYMTGITRNLKSQIMLINGPPDHVHALLAVPPAGSFSDFMREFKAGSSAWTNARIKDFAWQTGYSAFTVSKSAEPVVLRYIAGQEEHHRKLSFNEELVAMLKKHGVEYDERYILD